MAAIIVDQNSNLLSVDTWALVVGGVVINTILDTTQDIIQSPILNLYDYIVDLTIQGQIAGVGWTYNAQGNTFTGPTPPPIDWESTVVSDFDVVASDLLQCLSDVGTNGGSLSPSQILTAFNASLEDSQDQFSPNQLALMQKIYAYVLGGG